MRITLDVPDAYTVGVDPGELGRRIKLYAAILMFQSGQLSAGGAVEFAGVDRATFFAEAATQGVPAVAYPADKLAVDGENLTRPRP